VVGGKGKVFQRFRGRLIYCNLLSLRRTLLRWRGQIQLRTPISLKFCLRWRRVLQRRLLLTPTALGALLDGFPRPYQKAKYYLFPPLFSREVIQYQLKRSDQISETNHSPSAVLVTTINQRQNTLSYECGIDYITIITASVCRWRILDVLFKPFVLVFT
jgi:hypothetical protein